jgi:hypothetical protein
MEEPPLVERGQGHPVACHFASEDRSVVTVDIGAPPTTNRVVGQASFAAPGSAGGVAGSASGGSAGESSESGSSDGSPWSGPSTPPS